MSKGRLTRQELGWLLTQEAQGAAERLRKGVQALKTQVPPRPDELPEPALGVETTLSALDDTMRILSSLHQRPVNARGRRGRVDLASLLWEIAPEARVSIEPGSGTEVLGDESELRRMLHVLLGHATGAGSSVLVKRQGDLVRVAVVLGPDSSATAEAERAWLSRMAIRYGGEYELEGGMEVLLLPADGIDERNEREALKKELDEARRQGEAYARELAQVVSQSDEPAFPSTMPPPFLSPTTERLTNLVHLSSGVAAYVRELLAPISREMQELRSQSSNRPSSPDIESGVNDPLEVIRRSLMRVHEFVAELASVGELDIADLEVEVELAELVRTVVRSVEARAQRSGITIDLVVPQAEGRAMGRVPPRACSVMIRELIMHAIAATPRSQRVAVTVEPITERGIGTKIIVDDSGTPLPVVARRALVSLDVDPGTYGRPSAVPLYIAAELAAAQRAILEVADSPLGGLRVTLTFPQ